MILIYIRKVFFSRFFFCKQLYSRIFTLFSWRHDFLRSFLFIETTETEKNKKKTHLFIDGHFEVILCFCPFDNF
jgi:hypothetical protein